MGNSEVGHNAIGAGRIFDQGAKLVQNAIADGSIWQGETKHPQPDPGCGPSARRRRADRSDRSEDRAA